MADARFGNSAHLTVDVYRDSALTNLLDPSEYTIIGETGADYSSFVVPEPSSAVLIGLGLIVLARRTSHLCTARAD